MTTYTRTVKVWDEAGDVFKTVTVDVRIDLDKLALALARRTNRSKTGRSGMFGDLITAKQRKEGP